MLLRAVHRGPAAGGGGVERAQRASHRGASARAARAVRVVRAPPGPARAFHVRREPARALRAHAHPRLLHQGICINVRVLHHWHLCYCTLVLAPCCSTGDHHFL